jgi:hypothetical protein
MYTSVTQAKRHPCTICRQLRFEQQQVQHYSCDGLHVQPGSATGRKCSTLSQITDPRLEMHIASRWTRGSVTVLAREAGACLGTRRSKLEFKGMGSRS